MKRIICDLNTYSGSLFSISALEETMAFMGMRSALTIAPKMTKIRRTKKQNDEGNR